MSTLKVVGAGPGRTGTDSLREALEILGFGPCYHMFVTKSMGHAGLWLEAEEAVRRGKPFDFSRIFAGGNAKAFKSTVDYPSTTFFPEIFEQNPQAKVVLSVRDTPEVWADSVMATIGNTTMATGMKIGGAMFSKVEQQRKFIANTVWEHPRAFNGRMHDRDYLISYYKKWQEEVKAQVPQEQLLEFNAKEGWEPLCKFLGVAVPDQPFPRRNARSSWLQQAPARV